MSVKLNIEAQFLLREQDYPDGVTFEANGKTVGDCLNQYLATRPSLKREFFNKWGRLDANIAVCVNNRFLNSGQLEEELKDGDEVQIVYTRMKGC